MVVFQSVSGEYMKVFVINGPNLNILGIREPGIYGQGSYKDLVEMIQNYCTSKNIEVEFFQSNHEGDLVDYIQSAYGTADGIVINPGAYAHTSIAILDAAKAVNVPLVEVHISDVSKREDFRQVSYISLAAAKRIIGHGFNGYIEAINYLKENEKK